MKMNTQTRGDVSASWSDFGIVAKRREPLFDLMDKTRGRIGGLFRDKGPDFGEIILRGFGDKKV